MHAAVEVADSRHDEAELLPQTRAVLSHQERAHVHHLQEHLGGRRPCEDVHAAAKIAGFDSTSTPWISVTKV